MDCIICAFGVFFCPDYELGYREMYRVATPDSATVITSWKVVGWMPMVQYLIKKIRPEQAEWEFLAPPGFRDPEWVKERMEQAGWKDVAVREVHDYTMTTSKTAISLLPVLQDAVGDWTDEEKGRWAELFDEAAETCGVEKAKDGGWKIKMTALAATGRKYT